MSELHTDALRVLEQWDAPSREQDALRHEYVAHLRANHAGLARSCHPDHITASALVLDESHERVLLTLHSKAQEWFQLGGHAEPGDATLAGAALREATEESGIDSLRIDPVPVQLDAHAVPFCGGREGTRHLDVRFLAVAPRDAVPEISEESADLRWWPVDGLPSDERSLRELVELGRHRARRL